MWLLPLVVAVPESAYSPTCACSLLGRCSEPRPAHQLDYSDAGLKYYERQYWHWVRGDLVALANQGDYSLNAIDQTGWGPAAALPAATRAHIHSKFDVPGRQVIYLTYDDGIFCEDAACGKHLDFLADADWLGVNVSLFVLGDRFFPPTEPPAEDGPVAHKEASVAMLKEYIRRGHVVGSHSDTHPSLGTRPFDEAMADVRRAHERLAELGVSVKHFRPPYVNVNNRVLDFLINTMHYDVWGGINGGGIDWAEWELPSWQKSWAAEQHAASVTANMAMRGAQCDGSTYSAVLTMHDRPHELHFLDEQISHLCKVCPRFEFVSFADAEAARGARSTARSLHRRAADGGAVPIVAAAVGIVGVLFSAAAVRARPAVSPREVELGMLDAGMLAH